MVPLAIGTQTGGSVIRPAAYCGVVGFKPSFGLFAPAGMQTNTETLDTIGIMARSVADIALFRAAMMAIPYEPPAMPETRAAPRALPHAALGRCRSPKGRRCSKPPPTGSPPPAPKIADSRVAAGMRRGSTTSRPTLGAFEAPRNHAPELHRHEALLSPRLRDGQDRARPQTDPRRSSAPPAAPPRRRAPRRREWAGGFDAILTPAGAGPGAARACRHRLGASSTRCGRYSHMPCLTLPAGRGPDGLPVGIQLVGRRHDDARLLDIGLWVEHG